MALGLATAPLLAATPANADTSSQWALSYLKYSQVSALSTGSGVTIGLIDTGVQPIPDIGNQLVPGADFTGGVVNTSSVGNGETDTDDEGHGNGMASTIAGQGQPVQGFAPKAKILTIRDMLTSGVLGGPTSPGNSIQFAISQHVQVINISQAWADSPSERSAIAKAVDANIVVVVAAGNSGSSVTDDSSPAPAEYPGVVDVAAIDQSGAIASFSDYGPQITLAAPGVGILNDQEFPNDTTSVSGTSPATAYVSATAALIFSEHPTWTAGQVIRDMIGTADPGSGQAAGQHDDHYGYGIIDPLKALQAAAPSETTNPLLVAATTAPTTGSAPSPADTTGSAAPASSSSSSALPIMLGVVAVLVILGVVIVLARRGKSGRGGKGGKGGGSNGPPSGAGGANRGYQQAQYPPQQQYPPK
ncbi:MAG TPA: S8 family serine peptidase [Actinocrinis sp.]|nr:S8 family serine peptidase [Actinocrinis sp.]